METSAYLNVAGFGATAKGHFQACALRQLFWAFLLPVAEAEVASCFFTKPAQTISID